MTKIGIVGGGAVGLTYAALLSEIFEVGVITRRKEQADAINEKGISFQDRDGNESFIAKVNASTDFTDLKGSELVIIAVKSYDTAKIVDDLNSSIHEETKILTLQNGIEAFQVLKDRLDNHDRVFAGVTYVGASRRDDRTVVNGPSFATVIDSGIGEIADEIKSVRILEVEVSDETKKSVWDKLALNIAQNGLSAVENKHFGQMLKSDECLSKARNLLEEFVAVAKAEGLDYEIEKLMQKLKENWTDSTFYPSTWQDINIGRKTEIEALNGAIGKLGKKYNIPTPNNDAMTKAVKELEKNQR